MTRAEFVKAMAYVTAGCGKSLEPVSLEVYFDLLGDLPYEALLAGAKVVLLRHKYATFPAIAELRAASVSAGRGEVTALAPAEAWALAWRAVGATDPELAGSFARASKALPPLVVRAIETYGLNALCYGTEPLTVVRAQFLRIYEQLAERERDREMLPPATRRAIEACGRANETSPALALAGWRPNTPE